MSLRESYLPGTPNWVDIGAKDLDRTHAFYTGLFGWTTQPAGPPEETGGYGFYLLDGKVAAGYGPAQADGVWWTTYISVSDADATAALVGAHGGSVLMPPMDVMTAGRMAVCTDPTGAAFSLWQPGDHIGCSVVNEPGALCWNELLSRDLDTAAAFYAACLGWDVQGGAEAEYTEFKVGEASVAGAMPMPPMVPAEVPSYWNVYFAVADLDATIARLGELGGQAMFEPMEAGGVGRFVSALGPDGETFSIIQLAEGM